VTKTVGEAFQTKHYSEKNNQAHRFDREQGSGDRGEQVGSDRSRGRGADEGVSRQDFGAYIAEDLVLRERSAGRVRIREEPEQFADADGQGSRVGKAVERADTHEPDKQLVLTYTSYCDFREQQIRVLSFAIPSSVVFFSELCQSVR